MNLTLQNGEKRLLNTMGIVYVHLHHPRNVVWIFNKISHYNGLYLPRLYDFMVRNDPWPHLWFL